MYVFLYLNFSILFICYCHCTSLSLTVISDAISSALSSLPNIVLPTVSVSLFFFLSMPHYISESLSTSSTHFFSNMLMLSLMFLSYFIGLFPVSIHYMSLFVSSCTTCLYICFACSKCVWLNYILTKVALMTL